MNSSAIQQYPMVPVAELSVDKSLTEALLASVADYLPQLRGRRIWLACSGGRDSLALAALCVQLYHQGKLPFLPQLLHVDHGWQADSHCWAMHVAQWAQVQQLPCQVLSVQVQGTDEQAARLARYQAMLSYINQDDILIVAHHADDQAETVLMRLIQGAGVKGLSAMQPWRVHVQDGRQNVLWRPWLTVRRATISYYAQQLSLPYIDDPTNDSGDNVRSGLRNIIIPALATYNSNVIDNIARSAQLLSDAQLTVSAQAAQDHVQVIIDSLSYPPAQRALDIHKLTQLPLYRQRQLLHYWLTQDEPLPPAKQLVDEVLSLTQREDNNHQTRLDWHTGTHATRIYSIRRYRNVLYRISEAFLAQLAQPISEQDVSIDCLFDTAIILQANTDYTWQISLSTACMQSLNPNISRLKVTPLIRGQKLLTKHASRPQSGKKLFQTLGIPVWLRDSLVVVSAVSSDNNSATPLWLLSPFYQWALNGQQAAINQQLSFY